MSVYSIGIVLVMLLPAPPQERDQTPETLCKCTGDDSPSKGGIRTWEEFQARYQGRFKTAEEAEVAWRVYQASNRCDATMVIGRLGDTGGFQGKGGYCVLRNLKPYTIAINDVFIHGGTDRGAIFRLASQAPLEELARDDDLGLEAIENDRETYWKVIYNHEIHLIEGTGGYRLVGEPDAITPDCPAYFEPDSPEATHCPDVTGSWRGTLSVEDVNGPTQIQVGQTRLATILLAQEGCRVVLRFNNNEIAGCFTPDEGFLVAAGAGGIGVAAVKRVTAPMEEGATGTLFRATIELDGTALGPAPGPIDLRIEQRTPDGGTVVSRGSMSRE